jgi:hypothetical protein
LAANATTGTADDPALQKVRLDLVFRILPGPGNYRITGGRSMSPGGNFVTGTLLQVPTNQAAAAVAGDASFWGQYMADPGLVSRGSHTGPNGWDPLTWNSCRMDTLELNIFPVGGAVPTGTSLLPGRYQTTIHESDPKFATLGVDKFKCFVVDTTKAATSTATLNNVNCTGVAHDDSQVAHRLGRLGDDEGVHDDHPRRAADAGLARPVLLPQVALGGPEPRVRDDAGHELHHAATAGRPEHGPAPLAAVRRAPGSVEEQRVRRRRDGVHAVRGLGRPSR